MKVKYNFELLFPFFCDIPEKFQEKKLLISVTMSIKLKMTALKVSAIT